MAGILRAHAHAEGQQRAAREEHRPVRRVQTRDHMGRTHPQGRQGRARGHRLRRDPGPEMAGHPDRRTRHRPHGPHAGHRRGPPGIRPGRRRIHRQEPRRPGRRDRPGRRARPDRRDRRGHGSHARPARRSRRQPGHDHLEDGRHDALPREGPGLRRQGPGHERHRARRHRGADFERPDPGQTRIHHHPQDPDRRSGHADGRGPGRGPRHRHRPLQGHSAEREPHGHLEPGLLVHDRHARQGDRPRRQGHRLHQRQRIPVRHRHREPRPCEPAQGRGRDHRRPERAGHLERPGAHHHDRHHHHVHPPGGASKATSRSRAPTGPSTGSYT